MNRRSFLRAAALAACAAPRLRAAEPPLRAVVIGHTGRGDYGHAHDAALQGLPGVELVAVADADPAGLAKAGERLKLTARYADYREMLAKERPQLTVVATRHADQHHAMMLACLQAGAHVYGEKPFTTAPAEADDILAEASRRNLKIAIAHQMRLQPNIAWLKGAFAARFGALLEMRAWGKQDTRAGGEDMMVLGTHLFDIMRHFAGEAEWCTARVRVQGRDISPKDARVPKDNVGPVAGDQVHAQFSFSSGALGSFVSQGALKTQLGPMGVELIGTLGAAFIQAGVPPAIYVSNGAGRTRSWIVPPELQAMKLPSGPAALQAANAAVVNDWLAAIRENREPVCSGQNAAKAVEMVCGVYQASLQGRRVRFPLESRTHPLIAIAHAR